MKYAAACADPAGGETGSHTTHRRSRFKYTHPPHTPSYLQRKQATHNRYIFEPPLTKIAGSAPELIRMYNYNNIP